MDRLIFVHPGRIERNAYRKVRNFEYADIDDVFEFSKYAAKIIAQLAIIHTMRPELQKTFSTLIKSKGKEEAICALTKRHYKRFRDKERKMKKKIKMSRARRNASTNSTSTKS